MKKLTSVLVFLLAVVMSSSVFANAPGDWTKVMEKEGVIVYSSTVVFTDAQGYKQETVLFRFENTNAYAVKVSYYLEAWYGERCRSCGVAQPNDYNRSHALAAGQILTGTAQGGDAGLRLYSGVPDKPGHSKLTRFNMASFTVSR